MTFALKKLIGALLSPVTAGVLFLILAFGLSLTERFRRLGRWMLGTGLALGWILGTVPVADALLGPLEKRYPAVIEAPANASAIHWIVVLGHGHSSDTGWPAPARLNDEALFRLTEGIRLSRLLPHAQLVLSGGGNGEISQAEALREAALALGVSPERIHLEPTPRDTGEEAERMAALLESRDSLDEPFLLVTSSAHMPRSVRHFHARGLNPVPAPGHAYVRSRRDLALRDFFPTASGYRKVERAVHEYLGMMWAGLTGEA